MSESEIDQKHLELALEMVRRQLGQLSQISRWDLSFTILRAITNQFFTQTRSVDRYELEELGADCFKVSVNSHASHSFFVHIPILES